MLNELKEILISEEEIQNKVNEMAAMINKDYKGEDILFIGILKGSVIFMSDLARKIDTQAEFDFMDVSSYGDKAYSSGNVRIIYDVKYDVKDKI